MQWQCCQLPWQGSFIKLCEKPGPNHFIPGAEKRVSNREIVDTKSKIRPHIDSTYVLLMYISVDVKFDSVWISGGNYLWRLISCNPNCVIFQQNTEWYICDVCKYSRHWGNIYLLHATNIYIYIYIYTLYTHISAVKQLITINRIQNISFCLHNIGVCSVYICFCAHFSWAELKDLRLFLCTLKKKSCWTNLKKLE